MTENFDIYNSEKFYKSFINLIFNCNFISYFSENYLVYFFLILIKLYIKLSKC